jgi:hypothetical protein
LALGPAVRLGGVGLPLADGPLASPPLTTQAYVQHWREYESGPPGRTVQNGTHWNVRSVPAVSSCRLDLGSPLAFLRNHGIGIRAVGHRDAGGHDESATPAVRLSAADGPTPDVVTASQRHVQKHGGLVGKRNGANRRATAIPRRGRVRLRVGRQLAAVIAFEPEHDDIGRLARWAR